MKKIILIESGLGERRKFWHTDTGQKTIKPGVTLGIVAALVLLFLFFALFGPPQNNLELNIIQGFAEASS